MDLVGGDLGKGFQYKVELIEKKLKISTKYDSTPVDAEVAVIVDPVFLLDEIKKLIPGQIDDTIIEVLKAALLK